LGNGSLLELTKTSRGRTAEVALLKEEQGKKAQPLVLSSKLGQVLPERRKPDEKTDQKDTGAARKQVEEQLLADSTIVSKKLRKWNQ